MSTRLLPIAALVAFAFTGCATGLTGSPESVAPGGATVLGKVVSDTGGEIEYWVEFGPTQAYGSETAHGTVSAAQHEVVTVRVPITGLERATPYHYRVCAEDGQQRGGPGCGEDRQFTTQSAGCGDTVTTDLRLTGNLDCPVEPGFVIGADGVEIDLAGYSMFGHVGVGGGGPTGVDNLAGHDDVTVRNGAIVGFGSPVWIVGGSRNRLVDVVTGAAGTAVTIVGGVDNEIRRNEAFGRSLGIRVTGSDRVVIAGTTVNAALFSGLVVEGDGARIVRNQVPHSGTPGLDNGIALTGSGGRVAENRVTGAWTLGGISIVGSSNAVVENQVSGAVLPLAPVESEAMGDGIHVHDGSAGTVLRRNRAEGNEGDGIHVLSAGVSLGGNAAFSNGGWGIDAVAGVTDLGGNTAGANGQPTQCRNVFCP